MDNKIYFVWIKFAGKPWPQLWFGDQLNSHNGKSRYRDDQILFKKELTDKEKNMTLDELTFIFPAPTKDEKHAS